MNREIRELNEEIGRGVGSEARIYVWENRMW